MTEGVRARLHVVGEVAVPLDERRGPQPVSSLWELFFAHSSFAAYRDSTKGNMARTAALCTLLRLGDFPNAGDVAIWVSRLRALPGKRAGTKMSPTTVALHRDNLHAMFEWARASGKQWTSDLGNPVDARLCPFRRELPLRVALRSVDDVWPFLLATGGDGRESWSVRRRGFLAALRYLGLRRGEALGLRRGNVQRNGGHVFVEVTHQREPSGFVLGPPKTPRAVRTLVCRAELVKLLDAVLALPDPTVRVGLGGGDERTVPFLFPFRENDLEEMMAALRGVSRDDFPFGDAWHVFRHTAAVELSRRGASIEEISEWLGHADIAHTQTYLRTLTGKRLGPGMLNYFSDETSEVRSARTARGGAPPGKVKGRAGVSAPTRPTSRPRGTEKSSRPNPKSPKEHPYA